MIETLVDLIEVCIHQNWEDMRPCEIFSEFDFPPGDCEGDCGRCLVETFENYQKSLDK